MNTSNPTTTTSNNNNSSKPKPSSPKQQQHKKGKKPTQQNPSRNNNVNKSVKQFGPAPVSGYAGIAEPAQQQQTSSSAPQQQQREFRPHYKSWQQPQKAWNPPPQQQQQASTTPAASTTASAKPKPRIVDPNTGRDILTGEIVYTSEELAELKKQPEYEPSDEEDEEVEDNKAELDELGLAENDLDDDLEGEEDFDQFEEAPAQQSTTGNTQRRQYK